uniref:Release factor glutamine methyltransferase n=2 Tax=Lygus hesperus TaxID=30085 RepID=A0A0A9XZV9_LYGHE
MCLTKRLVVNGASTVVAVVAAVVPSTLSLMVLYSTSIGHANISTLFDVGTVVGVVAIYFVAAVPTVDVVAKCIVVVDGATIATAFDHFLIALVLSWFLQPFQHSLYLYRLVQIRSPSHHPCLLLYRLLWTVLGELDSLHYFAPLSVTSSSDTAAILVLAPVRVESVEIVVPTSHLPLSAIVAIDIASSALYMMLDHRAVCVLLSYHLRLQLQNPHRLLATVVVAATSIVAIAIVVVSFLLSSPPSHLPYLLRLPRLLVPTVNRFAHHSLRCNIRPIQHSLLYFHLHSIRYSHHHFDGSMVDIVIFSLRMLILLVSSLLFLLHLPLRCCSHFVGMELLLLQPQHLIHYDLHP